MRPDWKQVDTETLAERLGMEVGRDHFMRCPFHADSGRPNAKVFPNGIFCFRCGAHADQAALVMHVLGLEFRDAVEWLEAEYLGGAFVTGSVQEVLRKEPEDELLGVEPLYGYLTDLAEPAAHDVHFWAERGLTRDTVTRFRCGAITQDTYSAVQERLERFASKDALTKAGLINDRGNLRFFERAIIPFYEDGRVVGVQGRSLDGTQPKYLSTKRRLPLFNVDALYDADPGQACWLCEGPLDAMKVEQSGRLAIGIAGVQSFKAEQLVGVHDWTFVLCLDADEAGREALQRVAPMLLGEGIAAKVYVAQLPEGTDAGDWDWSRRPPLKRWR